MIKNEMEQAYHKIYLVYARQKIKHANANLGMKRNYMLIEIIRN